ncbi:MAG: acetolactate synthase small subunit [Desulfobacterales bacterium]|nr:MAG: acetolactate synthase small subunit [Desulfobacterales bacterium]
MTTKPQKKRRAILAFMQNRPGVLNKISMLIRRKMYNVETITACTTPKPGISRMTLTLYEDSDDKMAQVVRQIEKVTEVISARELDIDQSYWREVAIIKFEADGDQMERLAGKYRIEILDRQNQGLFIVQLAGTSKMIDDFLQELGADRVVELARSGFTALER